MKAVHHAVGCPATRRITKRHFLSFGGYSSKEVVKDAGWWESRAADRLSNRKNVRRVALLGK